VSDFEPYKKLLASIAGEWLQAEADIKQAEQICEEVVTPSVFELRYAGRRIVEAITLLNDGAEHNRIEDVLRDAKLDCHRARHDAVDAAAAKIAKDIEINNDFFGQDVVVSAFPRLSELRSALQEVRAGIVAARSDLKNRDGIYNEIETDKFPGLILLYRAMQLSEQDMVGIKKAKRRFVFGEHVIAFIAIAIGLVDFLVHLFDIHMQFG
jgi:hypothetical protein